MSEGAGSSKTKTHITFIRNGRWTFLHDVIFEDKQTKSVGLIRQSTIAIPKKGNMERHFRTVHGKYDTDFPPKSELRKKKVKELKSYCPDSSHFSHNKLQKRKPRLLLRHLIRNRPFSLVPVGGDDT